MSGLVLPWLMLAALLFSACAAADEMATPAGWEYRWGDSPFTAEGKPHWALEDDAQQWSTIDFPSNPPGRGDRQNVWFRVTLPEGQWRDPVLYIFSVDLIAEIYHRGERIYAYGEFDESGKGRFVGWPWHMVSLPPDSLGQPLYFRVFSDYQDIGLWGEVKVMERMALLRYVIDNSLGELVIGGFSLLIALLALVAASMLTARRLCLAIALLAASAGGMAIGSCQARLLILDHALFWDYLAAASYFVTPIAMALLLEQWFAGRGVRVYRAIALFFSGYALVAAMLWATGMAAVSDTYPVFDALFLLALPLLFAPAVMRLPAASLTQRAVFAAFVLHSLVLLASMAVAHGLLPWALVPLSGGALGFSLVIVVVSLREYARTREALHSLNRSLEAKVCERTLALEALADQERGRVRVLEFEGQKRGLLDEIITALQHCACLDAALAVLAERLPELCQPIAGAFYLPAPAADRFSRCVQWGEKSAVLPDEAELPSAAFGDLQERRWTFVFGYEQAQLGSQSLGLLMLYVPTDEAVSPQEFNREMLHCLMKSGIDKINLTLSIVALREELSRFSYEDALTGLRNRRYLDEWLSHEIALAQRNRTPLSVIICDIDHFKRFNDAYGHPAGDDALRVVANELRAVFRQTDIVCRFGGEEFVIIMPTANLEACQERAETLRRAVRSVPVLHAGQHLGYVTLSAGIACWPDPVTDPTQLLKEADKALYLAKQRGRDRVEACEPTQPIAMEQ